MKTDLQIIDEVIELLSVPERWTKGAGVRDKNGDAVSCSSPEAFCFCVFGATVKVSGSDKFDRLFFNQHPMIKGFLGLVEFNDDPDTTHDDIMALLHKTRESLLCK